MCHPIDPPAFIDHSLPSKCFPVGTNATYNCSTVSVIVGNPQPNLTANVTNLDVDSFELSDDTVMITDGSMDDYVIVECTADNGVEPVAAALGYIVYGSEEIACACTACTNTASDEISKGKNFYDFRRFSINHETFPH